jgi:hypothetical protein
MPDRNTLSDSESVGTIALQLAISLNIIAASSRLRAAAGGSTEVAAVIENSYHRLIG